MSSEQARNLRRQGIAAAKAGQRDQGRMLLQQSLRLDPESEAAWIWLASLANDQRERLFCFQKVLELNPENETALQALEAMGIAPQQVAAAPQAPRAAAQQAPAPVEAEPSAASAGVPVPDAQRLSSLQAQAEEMVRQYQRAPDRIEGVEWVSKSRRRAGERDSMYLRIYMIAAVIGVLAAVVIIGGLVVWNTPSLRGIVFAPTWTPTFTPTLTPTSTPGFTPTPSPTPELTLTPSPTIDPDIQQGLIEAPPLPTRIYPELVNRRLADALNLINRGEAQVALPTLVKERESTELSFDAAPYYYEALALMGVDDPQSALDRLREAESRLSEVRAEGDEGNKPLIDSGFAQVHLYLAQQAFAERDNAQGNDQLDAVELRAELAIENDPLLVPAYIALARRHQLDEDYDEALRVLNDALSNSQLKADVNLLVERGEVYFQQGEIDLAAQEAYTALYIDPTVEDAYLLQIKAALAQGDPGLAVIYAQNYLFFYPGSAEGYKLLGDARIAEGNTELALLAYDQALAAEDVTEATLPALMSRAQLAMQQRRYDQARQDYTQAFNLTDDPEIRAQRMWAAFLAGNTGTALADAENLQGTGVVPDSEINLLRARILIDGADEDDADDLNEALGLLNTTLPPEAQSIGDEYQARAQFLLGNYSDALREVDAALAAAETGSRRFLRGQVLEALERPDEAAREYEWVLTWSEVYPYPFVPQARSRLNALLDES